MEVLLIFKTHLDIGYTELSQAVTDKYINSYIPNAIKVGNELKGTDTPFVWTTGSWLIWEALKQDKDKSLEKAIKDGIITWHALPFTSHTELMSGKLFEYGISLSEKLDKRFGRKTIASKMTDVPGHTLGMVPIMKKHGIEFLHLGVNPATPVPPVPALFKWKCGDSELTVMYQKDYGEVADYGDFVIYFAHTGDNNGPQSGDEIKEIYKKVALEYPGADIKAATLEDVAERVRNIKDIPVIDKEIGDTWIHGAATDPKKLSRFRTLQTHIENIDLTDVELSDNLLLVPEHTWGLNLQRNFNNTDFWYGEEFYNLINTPEGAYMESSWIEQREYVNKAEKVLGITAEYNTDEPDLNGFAETDEILSEAEIFWQIFDNSDYERYKEKYMILNKKTVGWALWDFTKYGLAEYKGGTYKAKTVKAYKKDNKKIYKLEFEKEITDMAGLPYLWVVKEDDSYKLIWKNKKPERLPQACWIKFTGMEEKWEIKKMNQWISPEDILGSPLITATEGVIRNSDTEIETVDACLVAPFGMKLLDFELNPEQQDLYFNLYNNIWNTNFPLWYSDDAVFRFKVKNK